MIFEEKQRNVEAKPNYMAYIFYFDILCVYVDTFKINVAFVCVTWYCFYEIFTLVVTYRGT